jgi:5-methyltetrahydrofolate--homocysteine methyltransferase
MAVSDVFRAVLDFKMGEISELVKSEIVAGTDVETLLNEGLIAPMEEIGRRFSEGSIFVPEMLFAAKVMEKGLDELKPLLTGEETRSKGTVIMGTVHGDLHDIGKNLVIIMLEGNGFEVDDLGINVEKEIFLESVRRHKTRIVALSALLTTTMPAMEETVGLLKQEVPGIRIMVGGAPVTQDFADRIGADGYGEDAPAAVRLAQKFIEQIARSQ